MSLLLLLLFVLCSISDVIVANGDAVDSPLSSSYSTSPLDDFELMQFLMTNGLPMRSSLAEFLHEDLQRRKAAAMQEIAEGTTTTTSPSIDDDKDTSTSSLSSFFSNEFKDVQTFFSDFSSLLFSSSGSKSRENSDNANHNERYGGEVTSKKHLQRLVDKAMQSRSDSSTSTTTDATPPPPTSSPSAALALLYLGYWRLFIDTENLPLSAVQGLKPLQVTVPRLGAWDNEENLLLFQKTLSNTTTTSSSSPPISRDSPPQRTMNNDDTQIPIEEETEAKIGVDGEMVVQIPTKEDEILMDHPVAPHSSSMNINVTVQFQTVDDALFAIANGIRMLHAFFEHYTQILQNEEEADDGGQNEHSVHNQQVWMLEERLNDEIRIWLDLTIENAKLIVAEAEEEEKAQVEALGGGGEEEGGGQERATGKEEMVFSQLSTLKDHLHMSVFNEQESLLLDQEKEVELDDHDNNVFASDSKLLQRVGKLLVKKGFRSDGIKKMLGEIPASYGSPLEGGPGPGLIIYRDTSCALVSLDGSITYLDNFQNTDGDAGSDAGSDVFTNGGSGAPDKEEEDLVAVDEEAGDLSNASSEKTRNRGKKYKPRKGKSLYPGIVYVQSQMDPPSPETYIGGPYNPNRVIYLRKDIFPIYAPALVAAYEDSLTTLSLLHLGRVMVMLPSSRNTSMAPSSSTPSSSSSPPPPSSSLFSSFVVSWLVPLRRGVIAAASTVAAIIRGAVNFIVELMLGEETAADIESAPSSLSSSPTPQVHCLFAPSSTSLTGVEAVHCSPGMLNTVTPLGSDFEAYEILQTMARRGVTPARIVIGNRLLKRWDMLPIAEGSRGGVISSHGRHARGSNGAGDHDDEAIVFMSQDDEYDNLHENPLCEAAANMLLQPASEAASSSHSVLRAYDDNVPLLSEAHEDVEVSNMGVTEALTAHMIRQQADLGDPVAAAQMGELLLHGHPGAGLDQDVNAAIQYLRQAAAVGQVGNGAREGAAAADDVVGGGAGGVGGGGAEGGRGENAAIGWNAEIEQAIDLGLDRRARTLLGILMLDHMQENDPRRNLTEAMEYLLDGAEYNETDALSGLGYIYLTGVVPGVPRNLTKAIDFLSRAAAFGLVHANGNLGTIYLSTDGDDTAENRSVYNATAAKKHFEAAANSGFKPADFNLGLLELYGWDGNPNCTRAVGRLVKVALSGSWIDEYPWSLSSAYAAFNKALHGGGGGGDGASASDDSGTRVSVSQRSNSFYVAEQAVMQYAILSSVGFARSFDNLGFIIEEGYEGSAMMETPTGWLGGGMGGREKEEAFNEQNDDEKQHHPWAGRFDAVGALRDAVALEKKEARHLWAMKRNVLNIVHAAQVQAQSPHHRRGSCLLSFRPSTSSSSSSHSTTESSTMTDQSQTTFSSSAVALDSRTVAYRFYAESTDAHAWYRRAMCISEHWSSVPPCSDKFEQEQLQDFVPSVDDDTTQHLVDTSSTTDAVVSTKKQPLLNSTTIALKWFIKSARNGYSHAAYELAMGNAGEEEGSSKKKNITAAWILLDICDLMDPRASLPVFTAKVWIFSSWIFHQLSSSFSSSSQFSLVTSWFYPLRSSLSTNAVTPSSILSVGLGDLVSDLWHCVVDGYPQQEQQQESNVEATGAEGEGFFTTDPHYLGDSLYSEAEILRETTALLARLEGLWNQWLHGDDVHALYGDVIGLNGLLDEEDAAANDDGSGSSSSTASSPKLCQLFKLGPFPISLEARRMCTVVGRTTVAAIFIALLLSIVLAVLSRFASVSPPPLVAEERNMDVINNEDILDTNNLPQAPVAEDAEGVGEESIVPLHDGHHPQQEAAVPVVHEREHQEEG